MKLLLIYLFIYFERGHTLLRLKKYIQKFGGFKVRGSKKVSLHQKLNFKNLMKNNTFPSLYE